MTITVLYLAAVVVSCGSMAAGRRNSDYSPLIDFILLEDKSAPVYAFHDFTKKFDQEHHTAALDYLTNRKALLKKIKKDLGTSNLAWRLEAFEQRLLYVPENRQEYAELYEHYCLDMIDFTLEKTGFDNPYNIIETLDHTKPVIHEDEGISVFLVHNLATEYIGTYSFFDYDHPKKIQISLRGRNFNAEIGSYSSWLTIKEDGTIEFERSQYTIWQNSAKSPYNVLIVPIEETLHIALRPFTEEAIRQQLNPPLKNTSIDIKQVVEHWMSIEEAIVGGIVDAFFSQIVHRYIHEFPTNSIGKTLTRKSLNEKYRYLLNGIEIVKSIGVKAAIDIYRKNPAEFRDRVVSDLPVHNMRWRESPASS